MEQSNVIKYLNEVSKLIISSTIVLSLMGALLQPHFNTHIKKLINVEINSLKKDISELSENISYIKYINLETINAEEREKIEKEWQYFRRERNIK